MSAECLAGDEMAFHFPPEETSNSTPKMASESFAYVSGYGCLCSSGIVPEIFFLLLCFFTFSKQKTRIECERM